MINNFKKIVCLCVPLILAGCVQGYTPPPAGASTATLANYSKSTFWVQKNISMENDDCSSTTYPDQDSNGAFKIEANKVQTILVSTLYYQNAYSFVVSFIPKSNNAYFSKIDIKPEGNNLKATFTLLSNSGHGNVRTPVAFVKRLQDGFWLTSCKDKNLNMIREGKYSQIEKSTEWTQSEENRSTSILDSIIQTATK